MNYKAIENAEGFEKGKIYSEADVSSFLEKYTKFENQSILIKSSESKVKEEPVVEVQPEESITKESKEEPKAKAKGKRK